MTRTTVGTVGVTLGSQLRASDVSDTAFALLDERGTVVAWTQAAEHLVGYPAGEVVGRSAAMVLPSFGRAPTTSAFVEQCRARNGWSGGTEVRHRDGRTLGVGLRISLVRGRFGEVRWLASVTDIGVPSGDAVNVLVQGAILDRAPIGVVVRDLGLRCTWVNDAMESHDGISRDRRLGCGITDAWHSVESEAAEAMMRRVLRSGSTKVYAYRTWLPAVRGEERPYAVSFSCLQGADGKATGVCTISVDVAESQRERGRLAVLGEAGTHLGSTLDVMQTGQELADLAVPQFADYVAVDVEQSVLSGEGPPVHIGSIGERLPALMRAGVASIHPGAPESAWARGERTLVPPDSPVGEVLRTGESRLEPEVDTTPGGWIDQSPALARMVREHGIHSAMVVAIRARRVLLGMAVFIRTENPLPFQATDLLLAEELVSRAAVSLDKARRYCREHTAALALQRSLLPHRLRGGAAVEAASRYQPADIDRGVGGDWFDVIPLSGARVALVVGDVVGHGINAAAAMGGLRSAVRTLADMELPPGELLSRLDDTVQRLAEADVDAPDQGAAVVGATCLYAVYDPVTRQCTMATAGHPPPAIVDPQGKVTFPDLPTGVPLGLGLGGLFEPTELELPEGTLLALYTDGLIETRDHDIEHGMRRLAAALAQPRLSLEELCTRAMAPVKGQAACDDTSLLLVRTRSLSPAQVASWILPGDGTVVDRAQDLAASQLAAWGQEALDDSVKLIVSELVANAMCHSDGPIRLRLIRHEVLTVEVSDAGARPPCVRGARSVDEHGRGLATVTRLSRRCGTRPARDGKVLWAEAELAGTSGR
ncbi:SpoIIE family protein phosphatase [Streptomyces sp. NPDC026673]|uniref:SpoIIE family protein phosphatase n=1 Tax=Streptomyces sp. NPDC026673 TaxID=3155724 RepID=UPI0033ED0220